MTQEFETGARHFLFLVFIWDQTSKESFSPLH